MAISSVAGGAARALAMPFFVTDVGVAFFAFGSKAFSRTSALRLLAGESWGEDAAAGLDGIKRWTGEEG